MKMGPSQIPKTFSILFLFLASFPILGSSNELTDFVYKGCANQKFQDPSGIYSQTLNTLFANLVSQSSSSKFYKTTAGNSQSAISGLFQCRGDVSTENCNRCVNSIPDMSRKLCGQSIAARIQLIGCYLRYEMVGFQTIGATELLFKVCGSNQVSGAGFGDRLDTALGEMANQTGGKKPTILSFPAIMASSSEKRCLYEVLGVSRDCTADEIRSAYRKLALQRHPDKLVRSGVPESEATASFQELVNAYEVLSDARERAWYDSHRSQILFSNSGPTNSSNSGSVPDLFSFFSNSVYSGYSDKGKGFYKVYGDLFEKIYQNDLNFARKLGTDFPKEAPLMGNLESPYAQVTAFYNYWLGFATVMDFCWVDQYDVMAGPNRKSRRVMEEENKKLRKKARREYNETVRGLAEFVKKRDKRVIDMQMKRNEEMEKKKEEERKRRKELEREKAERARNYVEPEWAKAEELEDDGIEEESDEEEKKKADEKELYCVVCSKKFKSEKQWKNHEQSKKHKEKVAALREAFDEEDDEYAGAMEDGISEEQKVADADRTTDLSGDDGVDELAEHLEGSTLIQEEDEPDDDEVQSREEDETSNYQSASDLKGVADELGLDDDEASVLEAMISGRKGRKNAGPGGRRQTSAKNETGNDEMDFMEYNNLRSTRRNRGGRRQRNRKPQEEEEEEEEEEETAAAAAAAAAGGGDVGSYVTEVSTGIGLKNANNDSSACQRLSSQSPVETANDHKGGDDVSGNSEKVPSQGTNKKTTTKKDKNNKSKDTTKDVSKGRKQKAKSKSSSNSCETCGEEFDSRNQLHKHLGSTGHAKLKSR